MLFDNIILDILFIFYNREKEEEDALETARNAQLMSEKDQQKDAEKLKAQKEKERLREQERRRRLAVRICLAAWLADQLFLSLYYENNHVLMVLFYGPFFMEVVLLW